MSLALEPGGSASRPDDRLAAFATPRARAIVLAAAAVLVLVRLGAADLTNPDEPRYALVAEELRSMEHGLRGLVLLHLHGDAYSQKPPLYFWLAAGFGAPAGRVSETAARLPAALGGLGAVAATIALGTLLLGPAGGTLAGLLLLTDVDFGVRSRTASLDALLMCFETLALVAFWRLEAGVGARRRNLLLLHAAIGLALLTKGPVGALVPALAIAAYLAFERRLSALRGLVPAWGLALSLGPVALWAAISVALAPAGFVRSGVSDLRYWEGGSHRRPFLYYLEKFPVDLLPWLLLLPLTLWVARETLRGAAGAGERRAWRFLLAWIATSWLFFSLAGGKRLNYLLPIEPAFALLFAATLVAWLRRTPRPARRAGTWIAALAACAWVAELGFHGAVAPRLAGARSPRVLAESAAALARPGERIGIWRGGDILEPFAYYAQRRVDGLDDAHALGAFAGRGGRVLVLPEAELAGVRAATPLGVRGRFASGDAQWVVAVLGAAGG